MILELCLPNKNYQNLEGINLVTFHLMFQEEDAKPARGKDKLLLKCNWLYAAAPVKYVCRWTTIVALALWSGARGGTKFEMRVTSDYTSFEIQLKCYRNAIEINPSYADAHYNMWNILRDLGKLQDAELSTRKAIEILSHIHISDTTRLRRL